ncbi:MAG TPA: DUF2784 domain-containing protein [Isosphaeraceae bacterium]|jgi:hypothetical protein
MSWYRIAADIVVLVHVAYIGFVVLGLVAIVVGLALGRAWARNVWFRGVHLAMIAIVVLEAWIGVVCPLTVWERALRRWSGQATGGEANFIETWTHRLVFVTAPRWVFSVAYTLFGLAVLVTFVLGPPRRPWRTREPSERAE